MTCNHIECYKCRYDLFGLAIAARCPECNYPVKQSLDHRRLRLLNQRTLRIVWLALACWLTMWLVVCSVGLLMVFLPLVSDALFSGIHLTACALSALSGALVAYAYATCVRSLRALLVGAVLCSTVVASAALSAAMLLPTWRWVASPAVGNGLPVIWPGLLAVGSFAGFHLAAAELFRLLPRRWSASLLRLVAIAAVVCAALTLLGADGDTWLLFAATGVASLFAVCVSLVVLSRVRPYSSA
jgi:hypothetical protein